VGGEKTLNKFKSKKNLQSKLTARGSKRNAKGDSTQISSPTKPDSQNYKGYFGDVGRFTVEIVANVRKDLNAVVSVIQPNCNSTESLKERGIFGFGARQSAANLHLRYRINVLFPDEAHTLACTFASRLDKGKARIRHLVQICLHDSIFYEPTSMVLPSLTQHPRPSIRFHCLIALCSARAFDELEQRHHLDVPPCYCYEPASARLGCFTSH
jgi:hypothetical protein